MFTLLFLIAFLDSWHYSSDSPIFLSILAIYSTLVIYLDSPHLLDSRHLSRPLDSRHLSRPLDSRHLSRPLDSRHLSRPLDSRHLLTRLASLTPADRRKKCLLKLGHWVIFPTNPRSWLVGFGKSQSKREQPKLRASSSRMAGVQKENRSLGKRFISSKHKEKRRQTNFLKEKASIFM